MSKPISPLVVAWRAKCKHLPPFLRDFHAQKDIFKLVHHLAPPPVDAMVRQPTWVEGHCYVIDVFLWCMARHGYTLQRSRAQLPFEDIGQNLELVRNERRRIGFGQAENNAKESP